MGEIAWLNGRWMKPSQAKVSAEDRGFLFGDGVYEAMMTYGGRLWALERHLRRLDRSLREMQIEGVDTAEVGRLSAQAMKRGGNVETLVYVQITRGAGPRSHDWKPGMKPTVFLTARPAPVYPPEYWTAGVSVSVQADVRWGRCDIKSVNLLGNVLALHAAHATGAFEAVLVRDGVVTEGTHSGIFIVRKGVAITREEGPHILPSVTQGLVLEVAADMGVPTERRPFSLEEMLSAEETFDVGTTPGVLPITRIDGKPVGDGKPGAVTLRLHEGYRNRVAREDDAPRD